MCPVPLCRGSLLAATLMVAMSVTVATAQDTQMQRPAKRPRVDARVVLQGQPPVASLRELVDLLPPGSQIAVLDANGRRTNGVLGSVDAGELRLWQSRPFRRSQLRIFPVPNISAVLMIDPVRDGVGKGLLAALPVVLLVGLSDSGNKSELKGLATVMAAIYAPLAGMVVGEQIDASHLSPVYVPRSTFAPVARAGVNPLPPADDNTRADP